MPISYYMHLQYFHTKFSLKNAFGKLQKRLSPQPSFQKSQLNTEYTYRFCETLTSTNAPDSNTAILLLPKLLKYIKMSLCRLENTICVRLQTVKTGLKCHKKKHSCLLKEIVLKLERILSPDWPNLSS